VTYVNEHNDALNRLDINEKETDVMKKQENREANNQHSVIEDLTVNEDQAAEVKGGPIEIRELTIKVEVPEVRK